LFDVLDTGVNASQLTRKIERLGVAMVGINRDCYYNQNFDYWAILS
jgi:hypothetical protein